MFFWKKNFSTIRSFKVSFFHSTKILSPSKILVFEWKFFLVQSKIKQSLQFFAFAANFNSLSLLPLPHKVHFALCSKSVNTSSVLLRSPLAAAAAATRASTPPLSSQLAVLPLPLPPQLALGEHRPRDHEHSLGGRR